MDIFSVLTMVGGLALFLYGMQVMGDGLAKVSGGKLERILENLTSSPIKAVLLGAGVTAVIQSSSATTVMVVGFVNSGIMKLNQAVGIIMGANIGTTVTSWILSLSGLQGDNIFVKLCKPSSFSPILAVIGVVFLIFLKDEKKKDIGTIMVGFAVLMFGMSTMSGAVSPLRTNETFLQILTTFSNPLFGILFGTLFTCVLQSASAAVGILQALASAGVVDFSVALPIIMGIAIGAALPVLLSSIGANVDGKRTAMVYLVVEVSGVIFWALAFYLANAIFRFDFMNMTMTSVSIAFVNTLFRFVKVVILLPFIDAIEKVVDFLVKDKPVQSATGETIQLEERFIQHPALAIEQSRITINSMAAEAQENLAEAIRLLHNYSEEGYRTVEEMENVVDGYEDRLGSYLVKLTGQELSAKQNEDVSKFLHTISDFERISDHALNLADTAQEIHEKGIVFSDDAARELDVLENALGEIVHVAVNAFIRNDLTMASRVEPLEELIDNLCDELKLHHVDRLQKGHCTLLNGFLFNDLLTNYERVADHCSNIAVAMIELESDSFDTHQYLSSIKEMKSDMFERYYEEYSQKYHL